MSNLYQSLSAGFPKAPGAALLQLAGARMIFLPRFDIDQIFDHLRHATIMMGVPTFYTRMLSDARLTRQTCRQMRLFISGSAPLLAETHAEFGEAVVAVVVASDPTLAGENVVAQSRAGLANFKAPKTTIIVDALPPNAMGKVEKARLRDRHGSLFSMSSATVQS